MKKIFFSTMTIFVCMFSVTFTSSANDKEILHLERAGYSYLCTGEASSSLAGIGTIYAYQRYFRPFGSEQFQLDDTWRTSDLQPNYSVTRESIENYGEYYSGKRIVTHFNVYYSGNLQRNVSLTSILYCEYVMQ